MKQHYESEENKENSSVWMKYCM